MKTYIQFLGVGRGKVNWRQEFSEVSHHAIRAAIRKRKCLASNAIDVDILGQGGNIYAGDRMVGNFIIETHDDTGRAEALTKG